MNFTSTENLLREKKSAAPRTVLGLTGKELYVYLHTPRSLIRFPAHAPVPWSFNDIERCLNKDRRRRLSSLTQTMTNRRLCVVAVWIYIDPSYE